MNGIKKFFIKLFVGSKINKWLNGKKSVIGIIALTGTIIASANGIDIPDKVYEFLGVWLTAGFAHKLVKAESEAKATREKFEELFKDLPK